MLTKLKQLLKPKQRLSKVMLGIGNVSTEDIKRFDKTPKENKVYVDIDATKIKEHLDQISNEANQEFNKLTLQAKKLQPEICNRIYKHECRNCGTDFYVEDLDLIAVAKCPNCSGDSLYVEERKMEESLKPNIDFGSGADWVPPIAYDECGMPYTMYQGKKVMGRLCKENDTDNKPLLQITLQNESSVPKVIYEGKEIDNKARVLFEWETDTEVMGGTRYNIEHYEPNEKPVRKGYGLARGRYAFDDK